MLTNNTKLSFAKALYRTLAAQYEGSAVKSPPFEEAREALVLHIDAYLAFPGNLPYNGFDVVRYFTARAAVRGFPGKPGELPSVEIQAFMRGQQAMLEELTRLWMEMSGVKDATCQIH